jgi:hypothetical protein
MQQTNKYTERLQNSADRKPSSSLTTSLETVQNFENEPLFIESLINQGIDPHNKTTLEYANALSYYAEDFCNIYADSLDSKESEEVSLIANTPYMLHVSRDLAHYENERKVRRLDEDEWTYFTQTLKPYAVWYNQKLSDYMFTNDNTKFSTINETLADSAYDSFPHKEGAVEQQVKNITRGARTEAVGRQLLEDTDIQHAPGTPEDDLRGGDIIIIYNNKRIKVDLKSSLESIAKLRGGYDEIAKTNTAYALMHNKRDAYGSIVLFPGFTDKDLGDNCRLPERIAKQRSQLMANQLQRACIELGL